jgi:hypothetical protein
LGEPKPDELDPVLLVWKMHQRVRRGLLPPKRTVVEFDFRGRQGRRIWMVLEPREISVCLQPPGFDPDLIVKSDLALFSRVWLGYLDYVDVVRSGDVSVEGAPALARELPRWFMWSPMARHVRKLAQLSAR